MSAPTFVQVRWLPGARDVRGQAVQRKALALGIDTGHVAVSRVYALSVAIATHVLQRVAAGTLADAVLERVHVNRLVGRGRCSLLVSRLPGVTDDEGRAAQRVLQAALPSGQWPAEQWVFAQWMYVFERPLPEDALLRLGCEALGNPLIHHFACHAGLPTTVRLPAVTLPAQPAQRTVPLDGNDSALQTISNAGGLNLNLSEMHAIRDHFAGLGRWPSECELEVLAQTWSEHCKHKEFNALIDMQLGDFRYQVDSLFKTHIRGPTEAIRAKYAKTGEDWMLTVFSDNAGVVELDAERLFVLKVETHNSPSALDPVGGAMTGVLGNNRDAFGTGKGGARLWFNTNVLCFGHRDYAKALLPGQLHPARIANGVVDGIEQAGNKSGVPTVNGAIVYDDRYSGKPLVYCGTGAILPRHYPNGPAWIKDIVPGHRIVVVGGKVGQDGIHGATFSSGEMNDKISRSVVQIGSPITQKLCSDLLEEACSLGLVAGATDNGAGGLSSSVGELATYSGGASIELAQVPCKYPGLEPWEILLSESQERMTLAIRPDNVAAFLQLAALRDVEATDIGTFTADGRLSVTYQGAAVADLDLHFLHDGVPRKHLQAHWIAPIAHEPSLEPIDWHAALLRLLASPNICSRESVIRQYDHEVKGKTIVKPLMGEHGLAPQDAAVLRAGFDTWVGVAVASGICPKFGDLDPYAMAAGAFDEAIRSLVSVGAKLPQPGEAPSWSACDNFCVPDSVFHPTGNPDGHQKLGQLVRMCEALQAMSLHFDVPMTSGKDSMKNDFRSGGVKISVPPTVLFTVVARMPDVRRAITSEFKAPGDVIFVVGRTYDELGGSEFYKLHGHLGAHVPQVRPDAAKTGYMRLQQAQEAGLVASSHDCSDGGLAVCVAECCIGGNAGAQLQLPYDALSSQAWMFGESHSRLVVSIASAQADQFAALLGDCAQRLGSVTARRQLVVNRGRAVLAKWPVAALTAAWRTGGAP